ncbi:Gfo/Idh/MocA family protein [Bacteroidota bacterium]
MKNYNWGILGCGKIADPFAEGLKTLPQANLLSVASRSEERAIKLGENFQAQKLFSNYEDFLKDPDLDIVYVATTHNFHLEHTLLVMQAGKAVLCEKPLTVNADEARQLVNYARENNIFLMEAFWTRFIPSTIEILKWVQQGEIGEVRLFKADFGYYEPFNPESRSYNPDLAGGALLDVGVYPLNFAYSLFKDDPESWTSLPSMSSTGIDQQSAYILKYASGAMAILNSGVNIRTKHDAWIYGTEGSIYIMDFFHSRKAIIEKKGEKPEEVSLPFESTGYNYEAQEVMRCLDAGLVESPVMTWNESLRILELMDRFRNCWGMKYPGEG